MDAILAWLFGAACVAAGTEIVSRGRRGSVFAEILKNTPVTPFHALAEGSFVRVSGRAAAAGSLLTSPITSRRGLALALSLRDAFDKPFLPSREADIEVMTPFFIENENGKVMVSPTPGVALLLSREASTASRGKVLPSSWPALRELVSHRLWNDRIAHGAENLRYHEAILQEGDFVTVAGLAGRTVDVAGEAPHGRAPAMLWLVQGQAHRPLIVSNDPSRFSP